MPIIPGLGRLKQEAKGQSQQLNKALSNLDNTVSKYNIEINNKKGWGSGLVVKPLWVCFLMSKKGKETSIYRPIHHTLLTNLKLSILSFETLL